MTDQSIQIGNLTLKNPVLTASGTFGYGLEYDDFYDVATLGGICTKGLSREPRYGNPPERICETPAGMLNAIGLANVGVEFFCKEKLPTLRERGVTVIANIFASSVEDFVAITERLESESGVAAIELNVSCPNVSKGGIEFGRDFQSIRINLNNGVKFRAGIIDGSDPIQIGLNYLSNGIGTGFISLAKIVDGDLFQVDGEFGDCPFVRCCLTTGRE